MLKLRNVTIQNKLIFIIMVVCVLVLILTGVIISGYVHISYRSYMVNELLTDADIVAENCNVALAFENVEDVKKTLSSVKLKPSVVYGGVYRNNDEKFATYYRQDVDRSVEPLRRENEGYYFADGFLTIFKNIVFDNEKIGMLCIRSDLNPLHKALKNTIAVVAVVFFFSLVLSWFLASRLQKVISLPILNLANIAKNISEKKDYSIRAEKKNDDEVGRLIDSFNEMLSQIERRDIELVNTNVELVKETDERKRTEKELRHTHERLIEVSHRAGMAEVATDVLHNVGNVLNSVNVSTSYIRNKILNSKTVSLKKVTDIIADHSEDIGTFLTENQQGRHIPTYLTEAARLIIHEQEDIFDHVHSLQKNIEYIKDIVRTQQKYAKTGGVQTLTNVGNIIKDALEINKEALERYDIKLKLELAELPNVNIDRQHVLQILVNLINNGKYALSNSKKQEKVLTIRCCQHKDSLRIEVIDNGIGIPQENLDKVFQHGFTTKKEGHGFGLHSGALAAKEMGGSLSVQSNGSEQGAMFILELPLNQTEVIQCTI